MSEQTTNKPLSTIDLVNAANKQETQPQTDHVETDHVDAQQPAENRPMPLMSGDSAEKLRSRWTTIQTGFVDEPRSAVEQADSLVAEVMKQIAETFATERSRLEAQWSQGENVSTEDLRIALQRYRSFFNRLLSL